MPVPVRDRPVSTDLLRRGASNALVPQHRSQAIARPSGIGLCPTLLPRCAGLHARLFFDQVARAVPCHELRFVPDLKALLHDKDGGLRSEASLAIWRLTGDPTDAVAVGRDLLNDPDWLMQVIGEEHFRELGMAAV